MLLEDRTLMDSLSCTGSKRSQTDCHGSRGSILEMIMVQLDGILSEGLHWQGKARRSAKS